MSKRSNLSFNIAYCGITISISVIIMFAALIPAMTYILPAISGIFIWTVGEQINKKWGFAAFVAAALLNFMLIPEIEADIFFVLFFGYYPILRSEIEKYKPKFLAYIIKFVLFNVAVVIAFNILCWIININEILDGLEGFGDLAVYVLWVAADVSFIFYDICLDSVFYAFDKWVKPKLKKRIK